MSVNRSRRPEGKARSGVMLMVGHGSEVFLPFLRSVALAHLLPPAEFGLAIALTVATVMMELFTDIGLENSAMRQGGGGSEHDALPTLHAILVLRASVIGLVLAVSGGVFAHLFHAPQAAWSFSLLGAISFVRGLSHLEVKEAMRDFTFAPNAIANVTSQLVWTLVTVGFAVVLGDYRCMLAGLIASAVTYVVMTHLLSTKKWHLGWSRDVAREALVFGAPLIPNGIVLAATMMGDRFLIGTLLGLGPLAIYNVVTTAAFMPRGVILRLLTTIAMPIFLNKGREGAASSRTYDYWALMLSAIAFLYSLGFLCLGKEFIGVLFSATYEPDQHLVSLIALSVYMKFLFNLPVPKALAFGQTPFLLTTSLVVATSLAWGVAGILFNATLTAFLLGIVLGELAALIIILVRTIRLYKFSPKFTACVVLAPLIVICAVQLSIELGLGDGLVNRMAILVGAAAAFATLFLVSARISALPLLPLLRRA